MANPPKRVVIKITVDGREKDFQVTKESLTYEEVIALGYGNFPPAQPHDIAVNHAAGKQKHGLLAPGRSVKIKNRTAFIIVPAGTSNTLLDPNPKRGLRWLR